MINELRNGVFRYLINGTSASVLRFSSCLRLVNGSGPAGGKPSAKALKRASWPFFPLMLVRKEKCPWAPLLPGEAGIVPRNFLYGWVAMVFYGSEKVNCKFFKIIFDWLEFDVFCYVSISNKPG
ncbi:hypothetical protein AVEN_35968-1 [Araneus ventricosus]|uniref:Uncharacterized protein n=1 Tax=Araneus ventricosus TaxID=182803 RepID=A0A4Y2UB21_ARAVE|nr:hypothetical protein AVEN_35968-1 [Araneus ventricosus]